MRKRFFIHVFAAISFMVAGCSQNDILDEAAKGTNADVLNVRVTEKAFETTDTGTRAEDNGVQTVFETGDQIGVYIVKDGETVMQDNVALTYDGNEWSGTLYYYEGADYIAYYPYDEAMHGVKTLDDIESFFGGNYSMDQSMKENYRKCDWMAAEVKADKVTKGGTLELMFSHKMALLEFSIPTYSYKTSDAADAYTYGVPLAGLTIEVNDQLYTPYCLSNGLYRVIVSPDEADYAITGSFLDAKDNKPVEFTKTGVAMEANTYKHYKVTYGGAPSTGVTVRAIQPGDYYYADGNIVPKEFTVIPDGCIGVVFSTTTNNETAEDGTTVCNHGYVLALKDAPIIGNGYKLWETVPTDWSAIGITPKEETEENKKIGGEDYVNDNDGLRYTKAIVEKISVPENGAYVGEAIKNYVANFPEYAVSESTTGWFLPSVGQWISVVRNLGGDADFDGKESTDSDYLSVINAFFERVDEEYILKDGHLYYTSSLAVKYDTYGSYVILVRGASYANSWNNIHLEFSTGNQDYWKYIRPILAF